MANVSSRECVPQVVVSSQLSLVGCAVVGRGNLSEEDVRGRRER